MLPTDHLRAEVAFWRDMLKRGGRDCSGPALERIRQALALAERKLADLELPVESASRRPHRFQ